MSLPLFPPDYRAAGVLLHVTSLPSPYGVGDVGGAALAWIDHLREAGQSWWQVLPLGPTGYGDSPYQSLSSFAGNELLVSPDWLIEDELLRARDCEGAKFSPDTVDFEAVAPFKHRLLETAWTNFRAGARPDLRPAYARFCQDHALWLEDYALFRALKSRYGGAHYLDWPGEVSRRAPGALAQARRELGGQIDQVCFTQFLLFRQGSRLQHHARVRGVRLIGDLPFFVSPDSSDVWANPELFLLDEQHRPRVVAGVPPDYFSATGQLWGNPVYDWDAMRRTGYRWWVDRLRALLVHVDVIRLDHFRGFATAWHVPAGASTAQPGAWVPGPGAEFFAAVEQALGALPFIAEDLGLITPDVYALRDHFRVPGTRVLQFAFDGHEDNPYLPDNYVANTVAYTGTHDNPTTSEWYADLPEDQRRNFWDCLKRSGGDGREAAAALIGLAWSSIAALTIAPLQDVLNLGRGARMNVPGQSQGNWRWRCPEQALAGPAFEWLRELTTTSGRSNHMLRGGDTMKATQMLHDLGQSLWLDNITRDLLDGGTLKRYIDDLSVTAIKNSAAYDAAIRRKVGEGKAGEPLFFELALEDLTRAADLFRPIWDKTNGVDGWVSLEVSPLLAYDTASTLAAARDLHARAGRPNLLIKIPGTREGLPAIEEAIFAGVPINVTLLFSREQYLAAAEAFMRGIERRMAAGLRPDVGSVASVFISRWDAAVANKVPAALRNQLGIAIAKRTYKAARDLLGSPRWQRAYNAGARPQRPLWASTGTKDPQASDVLYVKALAAPLTVNTMPEGTLKALADHGELGAILPADGGDCEEVLAQFAKAGVDVDALAAQLQDEGAKSFVKSWHELMEVIVSKSADLGKKAG